MPTALPPIANFTDPATVEGGFKAALTSMRQYLSDLLNTTGSVSDSYLRVGWGVGEVKTFAYDFAPYDDGIVKIVEADGGSYVRSTYPDAFSKLGVLWGAADGTHFNVPNSRERAWMGSGAATYALSFAPADVNTGSDQITVPSNEGLYIGSPVIFTSTGTPPAPLVNATPYWYFKASATQGYLCTSLANAQNGSPINLTTQGTGTHTLTYSLSTRGIGAYLGEEKHAMSLSELIGHFHTTVAHAHNVSITNWSAGGPNGGFVGPGSGGSGTEVFGTDSQSPNTTSTGSNVAMNVQSPALIGKFMIKILG